MVRVRSNASLWDVFVGGDATRRKWWGLGDDGCMVQGPVGAIICV